MFGGGVAPDDATAGAAVEDHSGLVARLQEAGATLPAQLLAQLQKQLGIFNKQVQTLRDQIALQERLLKEAPPSSTVPGGSSSPSAAPAAAGQQQSAVGGAAHAANGSLPPAADHHQGTFPVAAPPQQPLQPPQPQQHEALLRPETEDVLLALFALTDSLSRDELRGLAAAAGVSEQLLRSYFTRLKNGLRSVLQRLTKKAVKSPTAAPASRAGLTPAPAPSQAAVAAADAPGAANRALLDTFLRGSAAGSGGVTISYGGEAADGGSGTTNGGADGLALPPVVVTAAGGSDPSGAASAVSAATAEKAAQLLKLSALLDEGGGLRDAAATGPLLLQMEVREEGRGWQASAVAAAAAEVGALVADFNMCPAAILGDCRQSISRL